MITFVIQSISLDLGEHVEGKILCVQKSVFEILYIFFFEASVLK